MNNDRTASTVERQQPRQARPIALAPAWVAALLILLVGAPAQAIMVGTTPNVVPDTSQNPANTAGWTQGDPGWANIVRFGYRQPNDAIWYTSHGVYIGDGWVLTAAHVGVPAKIQLDSGATFDPIPNQNFQVANPTWNDGRLVQQLADLRLIRINGDPGLPSLQIATQGLSLNDQIVMAGWGVVRSATESHFTVNKTTDPWTWAPVGNCSGSNCFSGYYTNGGGKRWGTNRIANSDAVLGETDGNLQTVVKGGSIAYLTTYDQGSGDTYESQAVGGDSGSAVFSKKSGQWQLAGIVLANYTFSGQGVLDPTNTLAIYGNADAFADLATYNAPGNSKIAAVMNAHQDYSLVGDINLDGISGSAADLAAFVAGWGYNNNGTGTITSWMNGDVTHDGKTDVNDFLRLRSYLNPGAGAELSALMSGYISGGIPEPSTAMLVIAPAILLALRARCRRPRPAA